MKKQLRELSSCFRHAVVFLHMNSAYCWKVSVFYFTYCATAETKQSRDSIRTVFYRFISVAFQLCGHHQTQQLLSSPRYGGLAGWSWCAAAGPTSSSACYDIRSSWRRPHHASFRWPANPHRSSYSHSIATRCPPLAVHPAPCPSTTATGLSCHSAYDSALRQMRTSLQVTSRQRSETCVHPR